MGKRENKSLLVVTLVSVLIIFTGCGGPVSDPVSPSGTKVTPEKRGEEIVAEFLKRDASPFRKIRLRFTIKAEDEPEKIHEVDNWRKQTAEGTTTLTQIVKPAEDADLGSLTVEIKGQKSVVTTYVASRGEFRETDTKKMFFGGLTAGELLGEWDKFSYRLTGEKELDGGKVFEVEGKLKNDAESVISNMKVLFRADNYFPAELHFFDNTGREIRTYKVTELKESAGHMFAARTEADNPIYRSKITIEFLTCEFPQTLDDAMFSREKLKTLAKK